MTNVLARKAVLANLTISRWGARRFDDTVTDEILVRNKAKADVGLFTKRLLNKDAMVDIHRITGKARVYHHSRTQPWLDDGVRILPTALYLAYAAEMQKFKNDFAQAVSTFTDEYPKFIEQAREELGTLFAATDYPQAEVIKHRFAFDVAILPCPDSADFRVGISAEDLAEIKSDLDARMDQQLKAAIRNAAQRVTETVGHLATRLKAYKPANKGKGAKAEGKFHDSLIIHVQEMAELLPAFNLDDDPKLTAVHKRIVEQLCPHAADALRDNPKLRKQVVANADQIVKAVAEFLA